MRLLDPAKNTAKQQFTPYTVQVKITDLYIRKGPGTNYAKGKFTGIGVFTIVDEADGPWSNQMGALKVLCGKAGWMDLSGFCNEMLKEMALYCGIYCGTGPFFLLLAANIVL